MNTEKSEQYTYELMDLIQKLSADGKAVTFTRTIFEMRNFLGKVYQEGYDAGYEIGVKEWSEKIGRN